MVLNQLRSKLAECEEALRTTEQALAVAEDALDRCRHKENA